MNKENMETLANYLDNLPHSKFDMRTWLNEDNENNCGTIGCIAGWACVLAGHESKKKGSHASRSWQESNGAGRQMVRPFAGDG